MSSPCPQTSSWNSQNMHNSNIDLQNKGPVWTFGESLMSPTGFIPLTRSNLPVRTASNLMLNDLADGCCNCLQAVLGPERRGRSYAVLTCTLNPTASTRDHAPVNPNPSSGTLSPKPYTPQNLTVWTAPQGKFLLSWAWRHRSIAVPSFQQLLQYSSRIPGNEKEQGGLKGFERGI